MKLFKRIYYPAMAVLTVLFLICGFVLSGATTATKSSATDSVAAAAISFGNTFANDAERHGISTDGTLAARQAITRAYREAGKPGGLEDAESRTVVEVTKDDDGYDITADSDAAGYQKPAIAVQRSVVSPETAAKMSTNDNRVVFVAKHVQNVALYVPGTQTADGAADVPVLMLTVRYDAFGAEATNAGVVGAAVAHAKLLTAGSYKNDILILFADAGTERAAGLFAFLHQFKGFNGVTDRISLIADFDTRGTAGPLMMVEATGETAGLMAEYAKINGGAQTNSFTNSFLKDSSAAGFAAKTKGIPSLSFANIGNLREQRTAAEEVMNEKVVSAHAEMMQRMLTAFGSADFDALGKGGKTGAYFDFAGTFTIAYNALAAGLIAGLIIGLLAAVIFVNYKKKSFSFTKVLLGSLIQLLALLAAAAALYAVYFLLSLFMAGFGVIAISAAAAFNYASAGIIISALILFCVFMVVFYILLKKSFLVKAPDVVRGNALIVSVLAVILSFAAPAVSYLFALFAVLECTVVLLMTLFKKSFKEKFGMDIERLFLPAIPAILLLPIFIQAISLSLTVTSIVVLPVLAMVFGCAVSSILPFADYLKAVLDKGAKKLPMRTIRYEKMVTEEVEDRAKKGKFTTVTSKKVFTEKARWGYRNSFGIVAAALIAGVSLLMCLTIGVGGYDAKIVSNPVTADSYYTAGALRYVYTDDKGETKQTLEVADRQAYSFISDAVTGMKWNSEKSAYEKDTMLYGTSLSNRAPWVPVKTGQTIEYRAASLSGRIVLKVTGAKTTESFSFNRASNQSFDEADAFVYKNDSRADELKFYLPYGLKGDSANSLNFLQVKYTGGSGLTFEFEEETDEAVSAGINAANNTDIKLLLERYAENTAVNPRIVLVYRTVLTV